RGARGAPRMSALPDVPRVTAIGVCAPHARFLAPIQNRGNNGDIGNARANLPANGGGGSRAAPPTPVRKEGMPTNRCAAIRADGAACEARPVPGRERCMAHEPALADRMAEGRREGGRSRSRPRATLSIDHPAAHVASARDVAGLLSETIDQVRTG